MKKTTKEIIYIVITFIVLTSIGGLTGHLVGEKQINKTRIAREELTSNKLIELLRPEVLDFHEAPPKDEYVVVKKLSPIPSLPVKRVLVVRKSDKMPFVALADPAKAHIGDSVRICLVRYNQRLGIFKEIFVVW